MPSVYIKKLPVTRCKVCGNKSVKLHHGECRECQRALAAHRWWMNEPERPETPLRTHRVAIDGI